MRTVTYDSIFNVWFRKCYPDNDSPTTAQKNLFSAIIEEIYPEIWNAARWNFSVGLEQLEVSNGVAEISEDNDCCDCEILQVFDKNPEDPTQNAVLLAANAYPGKITLKFPQFLSSVFVRYKLPPPDITDQSTFPALLKPLILAMAYAHWESSQQRNDPTASQFYISLYDRRLAEILVNRANTLEILNC